MKFRDEFIDRWSRLERATLGVLDHLNQINDEEVVRHIKDLLLPENKSDRDPLLTQGLDLALTFLTEKNKPEVIRVHYAQYLPNHIRAAFELAIKKASWRDGLTFEEIENSPIDYSPTVWRPMELIGYAKTGKPVLFWQAMHNTARAVTWRKAGGEYNWYRDISRVNVQIFDGWIPIPGSELLGE